MAIATVGSALGPVQDTNNTTTITYPLGGGESTTAGNLVVLYVAATAPAAIVAVSGVDSKGNTYAVGSAVSPPAGRASSSILYGVQSLGLVAADTITVTFSRGSTDKQMIVRQLTGQDASPLEIPVSGSGVSTVPAVTSSPVPTTVASSYVATLTVWNGTTANTADAGLTAVYAGHFDNGAVVKQMSVREKITVATGVQSRTDALGASQDWTVALCSFKASSAPPVSSTKVVAHGLSTRDGEKPPAGWDPAFSNRMIDVYWGATRDSASQHFGGTTQVNPMQPTDGGALDAAELARLDALIDAAVASGDTVTFRLLAGRFTPSWMMTKVGTFQYQDPAGTNPVVTVPKFWLPAYAAGWDDFISKLAARYDGGASPTTRQAAVRGCTCAMAMTYYAEPFQRHTNSTKNRAEMVGGGTGYAGTPISPAQSAGFSFAQDQAAQRKAIDIHAAHWSNTPCHLVVNPWQVLYSSTEAGISYGSSGNNQKYFGSDQPGIPNTKSIIDYAVSVLGASNRLVLENQSAVDSYFNATTTSASQAASAGTIKVASTSAFPATGAATMINATDPTIYSKFTYTGKTATTFTGCSGGTGTYASGSFVYGNKANAINQMYDYYLTKPFARYYQTGNATQVTDFNFVMRNIVCVLLGNAAEPVHNSGVTPYDVPNMTMWDTALRANSLPAGGTTAHIPTNTALPTIDIPAAGYTPGTVLTGRLGAWNPGSHALTSLHIQWYQKNPATNVSTSVRGPTSKADTTLTDNYTLVSGDLNSVIYVTVTATNSDGTSSAVASQETPLIITPAAPAPTNTVLPVATPSAPVSGDTITWDTGTWTGMPTSFSWDISRSNDAGVTWNLKKSGTDASWPTTDTDIGWAFKADVTANNGQPSASPATSVATSPVIGVPVITLTTSADTVPTDVSTYTFTGTVLPRGQGVTIAAFNVNGMAITVNPDGSFSQLVTVAPGVNTYTFTATDSAGDSTTESAQILRTVILTSADVDEIEVRIHQRGLANP